MTKDLPARLAAVKGESESVDRLIKIVVDSNGRMISLDINPRAKRLDVKSLADEILRAAQSAYDRMQEAIREAMGDSAAVSEALHRVMSGELAKGIPEDIRGGPARVARSADPVDDLQAFLRRIQGLL
ncbi:YbaB/EbfC family nucleoid-associated protein [Actinoallomurus purpureus]|uniref:YbaB/EbfC family nucleoid-associated protein n=1 Tax=Actinoallomurus purpureus TaxID=478114 RepID=UPI002092FDAE|nr:YbaB/EbfC family nucleoid-associated protein [Actinoallomurus purpureus]MCO6008142.1 YbaB/EbfC family nucleoid-associated protein [Actinoallomurus purpureus]